MLSVNDPELGAHIHQVLKAGMIETPLNGKEDFCPECIRGAMLKVLDSLRLDYKDQSLQRTPERVAKMYTEEIFYGLDYSKFPNCTTISNDMQYDELLSTRCSIISMCEHHFVPFQGTALIGYLPKNRILGLSKFNRVVDFFSRRPQIQERLTAQIHMALAYILDTDDVAVVLQCEHLCVKMRGIQDHQSLTTTSKLSGRFFSVPPLRAEFLALSRT